jgi:hypothetical protein
VFTCDTDGHREKRAVKEKKRNLTTTIRKKDK